MVSAKYLKKRNFKATTSWLSLKKAFKLKDEPELPLNADLAGTCFVYHEGIKAGSIINGKETLSYLNYRQINEKMQKEKMDRENNMIIAKKMASVCAADSKTCYEVPKSNTAAPYAPCGSSPGPCYCTPCPPPCPLQCPPCCDTPCTPAAAVCGCAAVPPAPCGCGCGCCTCLPPPCNCAPKCLQNMLGYYYYPYGTWFCGPYHQKVCCGGGPCCPCGPCCPGGPCKPCCPTPCPACWVDDAAGKTTAAGADTTATMTATAASAVAASAAAAQAITASAAAAPAAAVPAVAAPDVAASATAAPFDAAPAAASLAPSEDPPLVTPETSKLKPVQKYFVKTDTIEIPKTEKPK